MTTNASPSIPIKKLQREEALLTKQYSRLLAQNFMLDDIGKGWYHILQHMFDKLAELGQPLQLRLAQNCNGTLRVYFWCECAETKMLADIVVRRAERQSTQTCWYCGAGGARIVQRRNEFYLPLCDKHRQQQNSKAGSATTTTTTFDTIK